MPQEQNPTKVATKWALIFLVTGIVTTYLFQLLNLPDTSPIRYVSYLFLIGYLVLTQKEYKEQLGGYLTFGQGFSAGFRYALFSGLLFGVFMALYLAFLNPDAMNKIITAQADAMTAKGTPSDQVEKSGEIMHKYGAILVSFGVAVWFAILGLLISLVTAAILKKERTAFNTPDVAENYTDPTV